MISSTWGDGMPAWGDGMPAIDSKDLTLGEVFRDFYAVPDYQREYVWGEEEVA